MLPGFNGGLQTQGGEGFGGLGADRGDFQAREFFQHFGQVKAGVEKFHRGGAGECDPIGTVFAEILGRTEEILGLGDGFVEADVIDDSAHFLESPGQVGVGFFGAEEADFGVFNAVVLGEGLGDFATNGFGRGEVDLQMKFTELGGGGGADGGHFGAPDVAQVVELAEEEIKKGGDAVDAGKDEPVVGVEGKEGIDKILFVVGKVTFNGGDFQDFGTERGELVNELGGLGARTGDDDALAEEGQALEPIELVAQRDDVADDGDSGGGDFGLRGELGDGGERAGDGFLAAGGGAMDDGNGGGRGHAVADEGGGPVGEVVRAHEDDFGAGNFGNLLVAKGGGGIGRVAVAGEYREAGTVGAVREGDAGVVSGGDDGGDAGDHFKRYFLGGERFGFFAAAAEDERVAALEADDGFAGFGAGDHEVDELFLGKADAVFGVAAGDDLRRSGGVAEKFGIYEDVENDDIRGAKEFRATQCEQAGVAGAGAYEINSTFGSHGA